MKPVNDYQPGGDDTKQWQALQRGNVALEKGNTIQDRIFYVLLALAVIEALRLSVVEQFFVVMVDWILVAWVYFS